MKAHMVIRTHKVETFPGEKKGDPGTHAISVLLECRYAPDIEEFLNTHSGELCLIGIEPVGRNTNLK